MENKLRYLKFIDILMAVIILAGFILLVVKINNKITNSNLKDNLTGTEAIKLTKPEGMNFSSLKFIENNAVIMFSNKKEEKIFCVDLKKNILTCNISIQK